MYSAIEHYSIFLDSGTPTNRCYTTVHLFDINEEIIGVLQFPDPDLEMNDKRKYDVIHLQYPIHKFPYVIDVLRNEKPVYLGYWENEFGKYGRLCTGKEMVGEGEIEFEKNGKG